MSTRGLTDRGGGVTQAKMPLPFPLRWVNSYIVRGADGYTIIDPGLRTPETEEAWEQAMAELRFAPSDVEKIVLTHHHPDHYGMAGWWQERSGAPVLLSPSGRQQANLLWGAGQPMTQRLLDLFRLHGMDERTLEAMREHMDGFVPHVSPQPEVTELADGETVRLGDRDYIAIATPGHAEGHLCLLHEASGEMFCGDHVLPQITPNVSYLPGIDEDPLGSYLDSLKQVARLPVAMAYPGHREPFANFGGRALEIVAHHEARLARMTELLREPMTAYGLCRALFGERLSIHQLRFALAETIAHVVCLIRRGDVAESAGERGETILRAAAARV